MQSNQIIGFRYIDMAKILGIHIYPFSLLQSVLLIVNVWSSDIWIRIGRNATM
jgi:hypothetical protein